jgi:hypothetical protein
MLQRLISREDIALVSTPQAVEEYRLRELLLAQENFWQYRIAMNPRLMLRGKWFPRSLAGKLRKFWDDFRDGKRPLLLIGTPLRWHGSMSA